MGYSTSIVLSAIAIAGSVVTAGFTTWFNYISDERKRIRESEALIAKYRDPLLLAAQDLQSRLHNVTDWTITRCFSDTESREKENLLIYTAFVVGQYLSWTYIPRRQLQFLRVSTEQVNKRLAKALADIVEDFSTNKENENDPRSAPCMLWRGDQLAIGELMTIRDGDELFPMGYATFHKKWLDDARPPEPKAGCSSEASTANEAPKSSSGNATTVSTCDGEFRIWFRPIIKGVTLIAESKRNNNFPASNHDTTSPDLRLRQLQHRVVDLINILDPKELRSEAQQVQLCHRAKRCMCDSCKTSATYCPCRYCKVIPVFNRKKHHV